MSRDAQDYKRPIMLHVCKDGTVTYRNVPKKEKVFNGRALPVFSVNTVEEAEAIRVRFCRKQYESHPQIPGQPWYVLTNWGGELEELDRVADEFRAFFKELQDVSRKPIGELIANSSIGRGLADIKERGIDAHLKDLEEEMKPKRYRKRSAAAIKTKGKTGQPGSDLKPEQAGKAPYGTSVIKMGSNYTFIGANRRMSPIFKHWWQGLVAKVGDPPPNIEMAHKAYLEGSSIGHYAAFLDDQRSSLEKAESPRRVGEDGWYVKDVVARAREVSAFELTRHRQQNEISLSCGVGSAVRDRIEKENKAISAELERRRQLDSESLLREEGARRELDRRQWAQHTCTKTMSSMNCHACNAGVPYPHQPVSEMLDEAKGRKLSVLLDIARRLESEFSRFLVELDRLAKLG